MTGLRPDWQRPASDRFGPDAPYFDEAMARHDRAVAEGLSLYPDPVTGLYVMTAVALAARPCCDNGCRHCPWQR